MYINNSKRLTTCKVCIHDYEEHTWGFEHVDPLPCLFTDGKWGVKAPVGIFSALFFTGCSLTFFMAAFCRKLINPAFANKSEEWVGPEKVWGQNDSLGWL